MGQQRAELGFIGAGNMAEAIARGVLKAGLYRAGEMVAADPTPERRALFGQMGIHAIDDSAAVAAGSSIVMLAVKPQMIDGAAAQIGGVLSEQSLVVSIIAGLSTRYLEKALGSGKKLRVVRVMPNTPMLAGAGMSAVCAGAHATEQDVAAVERIFASAGEVVRVREAEMDAVTALSGSGPAYVFLLAEAMAAAGRELGLTQEQAAALGRQTVVGAARLMAESTESPAELRRKVTSPKGTTQAAIETLQGGGFEDLMLTAMQAAAARSKELGR